MPVATFATSPTRIERKGLIMSNARTANSQSTNEETQDLVGAGGGNPQLAAISEKEAAQ